MWPKQKKKKQTKNIAYLDTDLYAHKFSQRIKKSKVPVTHLNREN